MYNYLFKYLKTSLLVNKRKKYKVYSYDIDSGKEKLLTQLPKVNLISISILKNKFNINLF